MPAIAPSSREKREALEEVLQSVAFFRAEQLRTFLRYICEMELAGRGNELCESLIGVEAFGRPPAYSPTEDASVRRRAGDLREKLQEVYAGELVGSKVRIELPKGKFVPRFVRVAPESGSDQELAAILPLEHSSLRQVAERPAESVLPQRDARVVAARLDAILLERAKSRRRLVAFWFAAGWLVGAVMVAVVFLTYHRLQSELPQPTAPQVATSQTTPIQPRTELAAPTPTGPSLQAPGVQTNSEPAYGTLHPASAGVDQTYEAEAAGNTMSGITEPYPCNWCSGGNRVRNIGKFSRNYLVLNNVVVPRSGQYQLLLYYVLKGERSFFISVNNGPAVELPLSGQSWIKVSAASVTLTLNAGANSIKFSNDHRYTPDLDRVVIRDVAQLSKAAP